MLSRSACKHLLLGTNINEWSHWLHPVNLIKLSFFRTVSQKASECCLKGHSKSTSLEKRHFLSPLPRLLFPPFSFRPLCYLRRKCFCISSYLSISHCIKRGTKGEELHCVYLSVFSPNAGKYGPEKTPYLDTFHAVLQF